jgi:uncharacterized membrane protein YgcG
MRHPSLRRGGVRRRRRSSGRPGTGAATYPHSVRPSVHRTSRRLPAAIAAVALAALTCLAAFAAVIAAGPPFPSPTNGVRVYDEAGVFSPAARASAEVTIHGIEERSKAQVVVYTQVVEDGRTTEEANGDALALMNQWGVGRKGFNDGLVILFDMYPGLIHGQVILYGGDGFRATFLDNGEKQRIYEQDMLPRLKQQDFDGALAIAIQRVDAATTPEHAARLEQARLVDAIAGLLVAPALVILLVGYAAWRWLRFGRDPVYLDDPSIHMAGPPESLTPAGAAFILAGSATRRAITTALLDLASRGAIAFEEEHSGLLGHTKKVGIRLRPTVSDPTIVAQQRRNSARTLGRAERLAEAQLQALDASRLGYVTPVELVGFSTSVPTFNAALEDEVVERGWFTEKPSTVRKRWTGRAVGVAILGGLAVFGGANLPSGGLVSIGIALLVAGAGVAAIGWSMPAVSLAGAMIRAMLAAYRRTLKKTMDQARSMDQVVAEAGLAWLETPDQAVVWATALGLHHEIETVLDRSVEDQRSGRVSPGGVWMPAWYGSSGAGASAFAGGDFAGANPGSGGLFSGSAVPNIGGMMATLGSIGAAPSSSGSGGFGGGGGGGGGGGSGGGF